MPRSNFDTKSYAKLKTIGFHQYLRVKACFYASEWQGVTLYPGQLATSLPSMAEQSGETLKSVRIMLQALAADGFIKCENHGNRFTVIKLLDYAAVQGLPCLYGFELSKKAGADQKADARADQRADQRADDKNGANDLKLVFYDDENTASGQTKGQTEGQTQGQTKGQHSDNNNINNTNSPLISPQSGEEKVKRFIKPTVEEIKAYCDERKNGIDPERFFDTYETKGWKVGSTPMKDWKAAVRTWEKRNKEAAKLLAGKTTSQSKYSGRF